MRRIFLIFMATLIMSLSSYSKEEDTIASYKNLRTQIILYNLVNGLYLNKEQMGFIIKKAEEIEKIRENFQEKYRRIITQQENFLRQLKEEVKKEVPQIDRELSKRIHTNNILMKKLRKDYLSALDNISEEVKAILTPNQLYILNEFKPCLIPPKGSLRIGQAPNSERFTKLITRIREMPDIEFSLKKEKIIQKFVQQLSLKYPYIEEEDLETIKDKFLKIIEEARTLSDIEFSLQKENIAENIKGLLKDKKSLDLDRKITQFLLNPQIIPILQASSVKPSA